MDWKILCLSVDHRDGLEGRLGQSPRHVQVGQHAFHVAVFDEDEIAVVFEASAAVGYLNWRLKIVILSITIHRFFDGQRFSMTVIRFGVLLVMISGFTLALSTLPSTQEPAFIIPEYRATGQGNDPVPST